MGYKPAALAARRNTRMIPIGRKATPLGPDPLLHARHADPAAARAAVLGSAVATVYRV